MWRMRSSDMDEAADSSEVPATASPQRSRRLSPWVVSATIVGALLCAAFGALAHRWWLPTAPAAQIRFAIDIPDSQSASFLASGRRSLAVSPDGTQIAYASNGRLYRRRLTEIEAKPIAGSDVNGAQNPVFSPDGQFVAFVVGGDRTLRKLAVDGGTAVVLASTTVSPFGISWDDDVLLVGQGPNGILRVPAAGGAADVVVTMKADEVAHGPQAVPGTEWILFTLANDISARGWDSARIVVESLRTHERRTLVNGGSDGLLLPTGHLLYARGGVMFAVPFDAKTLALTGATASVLEGVLRTNGATGAAQLATSTNGVLAYSPGPIISGSGGLDLGIGTGDQDMKRFGLPEGSYGTPRVSPDGRFVAYTAEAQNAADLWIYDLSRNNAPRRLTFSGRSRFPVWSADGQHVAFQMNRDDESGIFWQRADGSGGIEQLTKADVGSVQVPESFSPRDERLLYRIEKSASVTLWMLSMRDRTSEPFDHVESNGQPTEAVFSPDGRWVAYVSQEKGGRAAVYVQPFPIASTKYQLPPTFPGDGSTRHPMWSRDGRTLAYNSGPGQWATVQVTGASTLTFSAPTVSPGTSVRVGNARVRTWDSMPDARTLVSVINPNASQTGGPAQINVVLHWFDDLKARVPTK